MDWLEISMKIIALMIFGPLILIACIKLFQQLAKLSSQQKSKFLFIVGGALASGILVIIAAHTYARITVANELTSNIIDECLRYLSIGTILLLFPFAVIGWIAAFFSKNGNTRCGYCLLIGGFIPAIYQYFTGFIGIQHALQKHAWTAAALSTGFLPFISLPLHWDWVSRGILCVWAF